MNKWAHVSLKKENSHNKAWIQALKDEINALRESLSKVEARISELATENRRLIRSLAQWMR